MIDSANVIRQAYLRKVPGAAWPMTARRLDSIYGTVQRVLRSPGDRRPLLERLLATASEWGTRCSVVLQDQATFNAWLFQQFESLMDVPFAWKQAPRDGQDVAHRHLSFGATQKFLNLVLKDWWARSGQATELAPLCRHLHAPLDDIVVSFVGRARPVPNGVPRSVVSDLDRPRYASLQRAIDELGDDLHVVLQCAYRPIRIEVEQLLWGWIR